MIPTYSFVIPVHNEQATLPELRARLDVLMERLDGPAEVVLVDDGSSDMTYELLTGFFHQDARYKVVHLSRNFGHQLAVTAGLDLATGAAVVIMDADLQDPPEVVLEMAARWREGYEVVYGLRVDRETDTWFKRSSASMFYRLLNRSATVELPADVGDFRLVDRAVVETFKHMREGNRYVRGMFAWMGFRSIGVPYRREARHAGESKYPLHKMARLAMDGLVGYSKVPLRATTAVGATGTTVGVAGGAVAVALRAAGVRVPGWVAAALGGGAIVGVELLALGTIGEYVGRIFDESIDRPLYVIRALHGIETTAVDRAVLPPQAPIISLVDERARFAGMTG